MPISVTTPIDQAIARAGEILFKPFDIAKWLTLGLCAFLATLTDYFGGGGSPSWTAQTQPALPSGQNVIDWISNNLVLLIGIVAGIAVIGLAFMLLIYWLQSRGKFMFLYGLAHNRGEVIAPWTMYRTLGNSLMLFNLALWIATMILFMLVAGICLAIAWPDIQSSQFGEAALAAVVLGAFLLLALGIGIALLHFALEHFVVPAMYVRMETVIPAWGIAWREIISPHFGSIALFLLMRILIAIVIGVIAMLATCLTCFVAAVPYVGTVILLPLIVFSRCYTLYFIEQIGPEWQIFTTAAKRECGRCGYSLEALGERGQCPECGEGFDFDPQSPPTEPPL